MVAQIKSRTDYIQIHLNSTISFLTQPFIDQKPFLMNAEECSQVLTSAHRASAPCSIVLMRTNECSLVLLVLMSTHEQPSTLMIMAPWTHISTIKRSWALFNAHKHYWAWGQSRWALVSTCEHSSALMRTHEHSRVLIAPWQHTLNWSLESKNAPECSRLLLIAHDCLGAGL